MTQPRFAVWVPEATIRALVAGDTLVQVLEESDGTRSLGRKWEVGLEARKDGTRFLVLTLPPGEAPLWPELRDVDPDDAKQPPEDDRDLEGALRALVPQALPQRVRGAAEAIREEIGRQLRMLSHPPMTDKAPCRRYETGPDGLTKCVTCGRVRQ